jgi:hypothetical protein
MPFVRRLAKAKKLLEAAIEQGSKMKCPNCGVAGRKDNACTHMTCLRCTAVWCYVCGLDVNQCDKAQPRHGRPADDIFLHNQGWEVNPNRCPVYLTQILEVDMHWLGENWQETAADADFEDDEKYLDSFHQFQTISKLQEVLDIIGHNEVAAMFSNPCYTLEEIISTSTDTLIDREEYLQYRIDQEEEDDNDDKEDDMENADDENEAESLGNDSSGNDTRSLVGAESSSTGC